MAPEPVQSRNLVEDLQLIVHELHGRDPGIEVVVVQVKPNCRVGNIGRTYHTLDEVVIGVLGVQLRTVDAVLEHAEGESTGDAQVPVNGHIVTVGAGDTGSAGGSGDIGINGTPEAHVHPGMRAVEGDGIGEGCVGDSGPLEPMIGANLVMIMHPCNGRVQYIVIEHVLGIVGQLLTLECSLNKPR